MMVLPRTLVFLVLIGSAAGWFDINDVYDVMADIQSYSKTLMKEYSKTLLDKNCHTDPDMCRNVTELITSKGYPCEEHKVVTEDGYILSVQRIPHGRKSAYVTTRPVVFLQHGLLGSSVDWVVNLAPQSLGFILADAGFDVWLGNIRGNVYSRAHVKYDPSTPQFWDFSWDEMAKYDLPAMVDHALNVSGHWQLHYIGHSQGTLIAFAQLSLSKTLASKIKTFSALGPVSTVGHISGALKWLSYLTSDFQEFFKMFGVYEFLPNDEIMKLLARYFCQAPSRVVCEDIVFLIAGYDTKNLNQSRVPVYVSHTPAGTSVKDVAHFGQMVRSGLFQMYDYGSVAENIKHYRQPTAPLYNAMQVEVPVALFSADNDPLADPTDVGDLLLQLPRIIYHTEIKGWNHLDFLWALDANEKVYQTIIKIIRTSLDHI